MADQALGGKMSDPVKNPAHYSGDGKITCKHAMRSMMYDAEVTPSQAYWWGCAFKYLWRWPWKCGVEDLRKCRESIDIMLEEIEARGGFRAGR